MKKILIACALFAVALGLCSGAPPPAEDEPAVKTGAGVPTPSFDGDWRGPVKSVVGESPNVHCNFRIVIKGDTALAYELHDNKWTEIADNSFGDVRYKISKMGDLYVVTWVNQGISFDWSEEQTYSLSYISPTKVKLIQLRHVNNRKKGKKGASWFYVRTGILTKSADD